MMKPKKNNIVKWLFPAEIAMMIYAAFTVLLILFTWTAHENPEAMLWWRLRIVLLTVALWGVYRIWSHKLMELARIALLLVTLSIWYPDTYELNCHLGNFDHIFASWDQSLFGFQPALLWSKAYPSLIVSELMAMGYWSYFLLFVSLIFYTFFRRYNEFQKVSFIIIGSFFVYYVIYDLLPVAGPQYYFLAVGTDKITQGIFPTVGTYFASHTEFLPLPGSGFFHDLVMMNHNTGERPTAAFPSSHVGIATVTMLTAGYLKQWRFIIIWAIPYIFLCMGTVYLMPHYGVDSIAGFISAIAVFFMMKAISPSHQG